MTTATGGSRMKATFKRVEYITLELRLGPVEPKETGND